MLEVDIAYGDDAASGAGVGLEFDLGGAGQPPSLRLTSTNTGPVGAQMTERIVCGERSWERLDDGPWTAIPARARVWHQVQTYLSSVARASAPEVTLGEEAVLRWRDAGYGTEVTLQVEPTTGVPHRLERMSPSTWGGLRVACAGWNTRVDIATPDAP